MSSGMEFVPLAKGMYVAVYPLVEWQARRAAENSPRRQPWVTCGASAQPRMGRKSLLHCPASLLVRPPTTWKSPSVTQEVQSSATYIPAALWRNTRILACVGFSFPCLTPPTTSS